MPRTSLPRRNSPVKIAGEQGEARVWTGRGIVIDLFRFSNTVCALLKSGRRDVRVYSKPADAAAVKVREKGSDLFSEIDFPPEIEKYDNSPYIALHGTGSARPALIVTNSGSPAVMSLVNAEEILIGCFANMPFIARYCRENPMDTLIVPACLYYDKKHVEDVICARALADAIEGCEAELNTELCRFAPPPAANHKGGIADPFAEALKEINSSGRVPDFLVFRPKTGKRDMDLILQKGTMDVIPRVTLSGECGTIENIYKKS